MDNDITITEHKIDKVAYIVSATSSENAIDTLHSKIEKLLIRDLRQSAENPDNTRVND